MGRRIRVEYAGATYHVVTRGNRRAAVFRSEADYDRYLEDLARLTREHGVEVLAFCLMPNHPHLCLRTTAAGDPLSAFMQRLNLRHARRYNWTYRVRGHLNEGRYRAQIVDSEQYLLTLVGYIHQNPVTARMVERPDQWAFSSHRAYLGEAFAWVRTDEVLRRVGGRANYLRLMAQRLPKQERQRFEPDKSGRMPTPTPRRSLMSWGSRQVSPWSARRPERPVSQAAAEVATSLAVDLQALASAGGRSEEREARRRVAAELRARGYCIHEIATVLGRQQPAISRMLLRARGCSEGEATYGLAA